MSELVWTKNAPQQAGYYFRRTVRVRYDSYGRVAREVMPSPREVVWVDCCAQLVPVNGTQFAYEWAGPIAEPKEPA